MPSDTVTLALDGQIPLGGFAEAMDGFRTLIDALTKEVAKGVAVEWTIDDLEVGSALATIRGESDAPEVVASVAAAYLVVGRAVEVGAPIPYSQSVQSAATSILRVLNGKITAVRFETAEGEAIVQSQRSSSSPIKPVAAFGAVLGRVQALTSRGSLRFTLYDLVYDKAVSCYLDSGREETMREVWGRLATVEGWLTRDASTGRPLALRRVSDVQPFREAEPGSFRRAKGAINLAPDAGSAEAIISRMRDAW